MASLEGAVRAAAFRGYGRYRGSRRNRPAVAAEAGGARVGESWTERGANATDRLSAMADGANMRTDVGARAGMIDSIFTGDVLGRDADIASGELRRYSLRTLANLVGDYYIDPAFLDEVALHIAKNALADGSRAEVAATLEASGAIRDAAKLFRGTPLILGIWGAKGTGKTFQTELALKALGVRPVALASGELEAEWAGTPARLVRQRYREAALYQRNSGQLSCLLIHDLDAGCGRFHDTQTTVNNQHVMGSLMNLCDDPHYSSLGEEWREGQPKLRRVPIIVTANDLSTLYAPLLRDGRMTKYHWNPTRDDLTPVVARLFADDGLGLDGARALLERFPGQPLDFFGALRARAFDQEILAWTLAQGGPSRVGRVLLNRQRGAPLTLQLDQVDTSLEALIRVGEDLAKEQQNVLDSSLAKEYFTNLALELTHEELEAEAQRQAEANKPTEAQVTAAKAAKAEAAAAEERIAAGFAAARAEARAEAEVAAERRRREAPPEPEPEPNFWEDTDVLTAMELRNEEGYALVDCRSKQAHAMEAPKGALSVPFSLRVGSSLSFTLERDGARFQEALSAACGAANAKVLLLGDESTEAPASEVMEAALAAGFGRALWVRGGFAKWNEFWTPAGKRRAEKGGFLIDELSSGTTAQFYDS